MASSSRGMRVTCGLIEDDLLTLQNIHVSQHVWNRENDRRLIARCAAPTRTEILGVPPQIVLLLEEAGFGWIACLNDIKVSLGLLTTLVERWRPETHTFHMSFGECTITLEDVGMLVGLPVDGEPLLTRGNANILELAQDLLGVVSPQSEIKGHRVKLSWLVTNFNDIADDIIDLHQLLPYARAWILRFLGGLLVPDRSSCFVSLRWLVFLRDFQTIKTYAWGADMLGCLYRNLCTSTDYKMPSCGGFTLLLQLWAWERFPTILSSPFPPIPPGSPIGLRWSNTASKISMSDDIKFYRKYFDRLSRKSIIWQPYPPIEQMPEDCTQGSRIWGSIIPLLSLCICEWHQPDRVMRQFGCQQPIPNPPMTPGHVHALTLCGKADDDWATILSPALEQWGNRYAYHFSPTPPQVGLLSPNSEYMRWYRRKGKLYIDPEEIKDSIVREVMECLAYLTSPNGRAEFSLESVTEQTNCLLSICDDYVARFVEPTEATPLPSNSC